MSPKDTSIPASPQIVEIDAKRARLKRAKRGPNALLAGAFVVLLATLFFPETSFLIGLIRAASEAAIVGGLADWFAVTALFRRPLGLPIPHTALIPARKDEIGQSLGRFVGEQFLAPELLLERLRAKNRALQLAGWLDSPEAAAFAGERMVALLPLAVSGTNDADMRRFFATIAHEGLKRVDLVPTVNAVIEALMKRRQHIALADAVLEIITPTLVRLRKPLTERIGERTGRFFPSYFDRKIAEEVVEGLVGWIESARTPGTSERIRLEKWLTKTIDDLRRGTDFAEVVARVQTKVINHPALARSLEAIWDEVKREVLADVTRDEPRTAALAGQIVRLVGRLIRESDVVQLNVNAALETAVVSAIAPWRLKIGAYIAETVARWDGKEVAEIIELQVGADLQYIRVSGTVVGALIGSALYLMITIIPLIERALAGVLPAIFG